MMYIEKILKEQEIQEKSEKAREGTSIALGYQIRGHEESLMVEKLKNQV